MKTVKTIAFCGLDGSGKSTQLKLVKNNLLKDKRILIAKLPYSPLNDLGKNPLKDLILEGRSGVEIIKYYLRLQGRESSKYDYILHDRHMLCFLAYAHAYGIKNIQTIKSLLNIIKNPDLTLYFDIPPEIAVKRIIERGEPINKHENIETLSKVREGYHRGIKLFPNVEIIEAKRPIEQTTEHIKKILIKNDIIK